MSAEYRFCPNCATPLELLGLQEDSGLVERLGAEQLAPLKAGIWGRVATASTVLRDGDRVELTRPLTVDPMEARRLRYRRDGVKRRAPVSGNRSR